VKDCPLGQHACGTRKIGADGDVSAVLDSPFEVRETQGLQVVDASTFPKIPGSFILSVICMIAEKASDALIANVREIDRKRKMIAERNNDIK
jgi:choline dehydrogenase-like flavoprotein